MHPLGFLSKLSCTTCNIGASAKVWAKTNDDEVGTAAVGWSLKLFQNCNVEKVLKNVKGEGGEDDEDKWSRSSVEVRVVPRSRTFDFG